MVVHTDIENLPFFKNAVITIGTFDGVHSGHLQIISQLKKEAININGESVINILAVSIGGITNFIPASGQPVQ